MPDGSYTLTEDQLADLQRIRDSIDVAGVALGDGDLHPLVCRKLASSIGLTSEAFGQLIEAIEGNG